MPASGKMLKNKAQKANREAGIGDAQGRMPSRVKAAEVMGRCTKCFVEIRMTKTNTEAKAHLESKHSGMTFAECFPGQFDPTVAVAAAPTETATAAPTATSTATAAPAAAAAAKKKKKQDLSFLDASL